MCVIRLYFYLLSFNLRLLLQEFVSPRTWTKTTTIIDERYEWTNNKQF